MANIVSEADLSEQERLPKMLCAYCNAQWTGEMIQGYCNADLEYGYYEAVDIKHTTVIEIFCSSCKKLLYSKEIITTSSN